LTKGVTVARYREKLNLSASCYGKYSPIRAIDWPGRSTGAHPENAGSPEPVLAQDDAFVCAYRAQS
jgi:hypothetical protein